ncbi:MAG: DUF4012 domain-containing protein [Chloroflexi bacterium]|nr:DUF4012 domain-containing protein [Chloroflexota bacterium]
MPSESVQIEALKLILEKSLRPGELDHHPWTASLIVSDAISNGSIPNDKSPGHQLVLAIANLFHEMRPSTPPKRGKRLDTSWGEFGLLASQYFAPLLFGSPNPVSLRDAWGRIDQSILLFVFNGSGGAVSEADKEAYRLVGNEPEVAPNSTLSDWHRKGLQHLMSAIQTRENYLSALLAQPSVISQEPPQSASPVSTELRDKKGKSPKRGKRRLFLVIAILMALLVIITGPKAWTIYRLATNVRRDVAQLQEITSTSDSRLEQLKAAAPALGDLRRDFTRLKNETEMFFWMGPLLEWSPAYGGELGSIRELATIAESMLISADTASQAGLPLLDKYHNEGVSMPLLLADIVKIQPQLAGAQEHMKRAVDARSRLDTGTLSPEIRDLILNQVDPLLVSMNTALAASTELPRLLGASEEGPKTYLLLVQNEDELRPTGGFITAAGTLLLQDGQIGNLEFIDSGQVDNWGKVYPAAPCQLREYMNSPVLVFRDANWFTDYPTAALYAENLFSYFNEHSVDGVIAFDQQLLIKMLRITGDVRVEGVDYPINAENVVSYMRIHKEDPGASGVGRKGFMPKLAAALLDKIMDGNMDMEELARVLLEALNERHLLLQVDNPVIASALRQYDWDGAVRPDTGDFLMVVDSNIGFNKTNAVVESSLHYDIDLTKTSSPFATLTVFHRNNAPPVIYCKHWNKVRLEGEDVYPITDCYWNYMRVYKKEGTTLLDATPQYVPDNWMIVKPKNQGQVDILTEEIEGAQAFGTLQVLPGGEALSVAFRFALPASVLENTPDSKQIVYRLKVQKQPGTLAIPITIRIHIPQNALLGRAPGGAVVEENNILYETNLQTDLEFDILFSMP